MHLSVVALLPVLSLLASAVPTKPRGGIVVPLTRRVKLVDEQGVVDVTILKDQVAKTSSKIYRGFRAFQKNTGSNHPSDTGHLSKRETGSDSLTNHDGALWYGSISVGTPAVSFTVDFDTGSSDFFLPGSNCQANCQGHKVYDTGASSTARDLGKSFNLTFHDGSSVSGEQFTDTVTLAGLTATEQTVGSATEYSTKFGLDTFPPDGLMGMAFPEVSAFEANPVFQTLVAQGQTTSPEFAFKLAPSGSELFLGGVNNDMFKGTFTQNPVTQVGFWQIALEAVNVNNSATVTGLSAIIDTGASLIVGNSAAVREFYAAIPGSQDVSSTVGKGFYTVPCNNIPDVSLTFSGKSFAISRDTFNQGAVSAGSSECVGGIVAEDSGDYWIVGGVFLQNVYTSFDVGNQSVGFADVA